MDYAVENLWLEGWEVARRMHEEMQRGGRSGSLRSGRWRGELAPAA